jgi:dnd system-associated protein 4
MADIRIRVAQNKTETLKALQDPAKATGPFQFYVDILSFAASLGMRHGTRKKIDEYSKEIDPIRQDIFKNSGYDQLINLAALISTGDPKILANDDKSEEMRIKIFEEYANAGLEILEDRMRGFTDHTECILLLLSETLDDKDSDLDELEIEKLLLD